MLRRTGLIFDIRLQCRKSFRQVGKGFIEIVIFGYPARYYYQETVVQYRPGDKVTVTLLRNKKEKKIEVELKNSRGNTEIVKLADMEVLGAVFQEVPEQTRRQLNIGYGMQVSNVKNGLMKDEGIQKGYIILKINNKQIRSIDDIEQAYKEAADSPDQVLFITGVYPSGRRANYAVNLSEE